MTGSANRSTIDGSLPRLTTGLFPNQDMNLQSLNQQFAIDGHLMIRTGTGDFPIIEIQNQFASAAISLYGAQVLSFRPAGHTEDLLFLSEQSLYQTGKAIRGGIPVCWPWFGPDPKGLQRPNHGFVRNRFWRLQASEMLADGQVRVRLAFDETLKQENTWRQPFELRLEVTIGRELSLKLTTCNRSDKAFSITQAFHSYFRVGRIQRVSIEGLDGCDYFDKLDQGTQKQHVGKLGVTQEIDNVYIDVNQDLTLNDPVLKRRIRIHAPNTSTAVVWNPWTKAGKKMSDLANTDYRHFVCVEAGNIAFDLIAIPPGGEFSMAASYRILPY